ncbi:hypothetical protein [Flavobacterium pectinovorum]|uniref:hypothetical protein n=1 Tax=Flavobacterium pectinovorum TaxID=29533 RepID=UPI001FAD4DC7|nr:hypothetical protein [Flavobacterium pectinovorum]MCI9843600.1 hypothetical protein [Flavobacterium pectinovorum]
MKKCLLCQEKEADKTGSHIVPHFLMKRIDNQNGAKGRDKELGFVIGKLETKGYFGRNILPEDLEKIYGEVDEQLIENNDISLVVDHFFCSDCEKNLGNLESLYAVSLNKTADHDTTYNSIEKEGIGFLFWISILWRLSILEKCGIKLKEKEERKLRRILKKYLTDDNFVTSDEDLKNIGYKLIRAANYKQVPHTYLHCSGFNIRPYSIMVDEFILFFYFKTTYLKAMECTFYGSEILIKKAEYNTAFAPERILSIKESELQEIIQNLVNHIASLRMNEYAQILDQLHQKLGGKGKMDVRLKQKIFDNIAASEEPIGKKYSFENIRKIMVATIMEDN